MSAAPFQADSLEEWLSIPGFSGAYEASTSGRIRRSKTGRVLSAFPDRYGYLRVSLNRADSRRQSYYVHQLVIRTFRGPMPLGQQVRHVVTNDRAVTALWNLAYGTPAENTADKFRHGTVLRGEHNPSARLASGDAIVIKMLCHERVASQRAIGRAMRTPQATVWNIFHGRTWSGL